MTKKVKTTARAVTPPASVTAGPITFHNQLLAAGLSAPDAAGLSALDELTAAAIEYGRAFAETEPKKHSQRRIDAHARLTIAARQYERSRVRAVRAPLAATRAL